MSVVVKTTPELRKWIAHNLDRGCTPAELIDSMVSQRFEPAIARGLINVFVDARARGSALPADALTLDVPAPEYIYEPSRLAAGNALLTDDRAIPVLLRLQWPQIAVLGNVVSTDECERLMELSRHRLKPSTIVDPASGLNVASSYRASEGMFFRPGETPLIAQLEKRIAQIMNVPLEYGEGLQVLRYAPGMRSEPHFDFLIPSNDANRESLVRSGQRTASLVIYLTDAAGGETVFPEAGVAVSPLRGNAVYFEYCNSRGQVDYKSLHAGAPVIEGEKWVLTKWVRQRRYVPA